jgi:hypothetical protein
MKIDVLCCSSCGQRLQVVCPEHGENYVPDRRVNLADEPKQKRRIGSRPTTVERRQGERRGMLQHISEDPAHPTSIVEIVSLSGNPYGSVTVGLAHLIAEGRIQRVGKGLYVRTVRPSPEPAG